MVNVYIPTPFRSFVGNRSSVEIEGRNVAEALANLDARFPGFRNLCYNAEGAIPPHINVYVNNQEITSLNGEATALADGDQLAVIPALAGGAGEEEPANYALTPERVMRYSRHLIMPQVGSVGQRKIFEAKVLIVGAVHDDVVLRDDAQRVLGVQRLLVRDHLDVGVVRGERLPGGVNLALTHVVVLVQDLPLQVRQVDGVEVDDADGADAGEAQVERDR